MVLKEAGEPDAAAAAFEAALRCQPLSAPAHAQLGEVLLKRGRTDEAVAHLKQAVELNPNDAASKTLLEGVRK
jgi:tetratricopeptide (TPR) repeat protein